MGKPLLKSFDLITGMIGSDNGSEGGRIRRGIEETKFVSREESRGIVLFPIPGRSNGVCGTEWVIFVITGGIGIGMSAIGSKRGSEFRQSAGVALHLEFEGIYRLLSV